VRANLSSLTRASVLLLVSGTFAAACGRSDLELTEPGFDEGGFDGGGQDISVPPPFDTGLEDVINSIDAPPPSDVELVDTVPDSITSTCGDGMCDDGETCFSCPRDCGLCKNCPDGMCNDGKTCSSCAPDCGPCPGCGDHVCQPTENCYTCPEDCGTCPGCGDGTCEPDETCASCPADCGVCAVCGNGKCQPPVETCATCPADCGDCTTSMTCLEVLTCAFGCASGDSFSLACAETCIAEGCDNAQVAANAVLDCALAAAVTCGGFRLACIQSACAGPIATCTNLSCQEM
jgi:hypothetical protein